MAGGFQQTNILTDEEMLDPGNVIRMQDYRTGARAQHNTTQWGVPEGKKGIGGEAPRRDGDKPGKLKLLDDQERIAQIKAALPAAIVAHNASMADEPATFLALCDAIAEVTGTRPRFAHGAIWLYDPALGYWMRAEPQDRYFLYRLLNDEPEASGSNQFRTGVKFLTRLDSLVGKMREIDAPTQFAGELPGLILETNLQPDRLDERKAIKQAVIWEPRADGKVYYVPPAPEHLKRFAHWDPEMGIDQVVEVSDGPPDCYEWDRYLDSLWQDDPDRATKQACLEAFLGCCMAGIATRMQVMLIFLGGGANGKSILMEFIERHLFGPGQSCSLPPDEWRGFMKARLDGPLINLVPELDERSVFANAAFKSALAGETMVTDVKNKASYQFAPRAGHIFAANTMPPATDHTVGFLRRFIMIGFNRDFRDDPSRQNPEEVLERLTPLAPLVRARCMWACAAAMKANAYPVPAEHKMLLNNWATRSNNYKHFADSVLVNDPGQRIEQSALFKAYKSFCKAVGSPYGSSRKLYEEMAMLGYHRDDPNPSKRRYYQGICLKAAEDWGDGSAEAAESEGYAKWGI